MTKLYVGNATKQNLKFTYRIPGGAARVQDIPIGGQVLLSGEMNSNDVENIIDQNAKYGFIDVREIDRSKEFIGFCYSIDKPISLPQLEKVFHKNHEVLVQRGKETRENFAVAINNELEDELMRSGMGNLKGMEVSIIEQDSPTRPSDAGPMVNEGIRVSRNEEPSRPVARARGSRRSG